MSYDPSDPTEPTRSQTPHTPAGSVRHGAHDTESSSSSRPPAGVVTPHGRPGVYIYPFWQRTEFWVMLLTSLAIMIATAIEDGFPAQAGWTLITVLGASYIISRGLAKREPRDDGADQPWTPGR